MSWAGTEPIHAYLGSSKAAVMKVGEQAQWADCDSANAGWSWVADTAMSRAGRRSTRSVKLWLSGALAQPFILPALAGVKSLGEAMKIAQHVANERTGLGADCAIHLDGWKRDEACLAAAMNSGLLESLLSTPAGSSIRVAIIRPWWSEVINACVLSSASTKLIGVREHDALTVIGGHGDTIDLASNHPAADLPTARQLLARLAVANDRTDDVESAIFTLAGLSSSANPMAANALVLDAPFGAIKEPAA